jgi:hypothetical protein
VQTVDGPGTGQFEIDGLDPSQYVLTTTAAHHQALSDNWEEMGVAKAEFSTDGQRVDLGEIVLVYQPQY